MKVRCTYCKAVFGVEERKGLGCPQCGRVIILPPSTRPKSRCVSRHERDQARLQNAKDVTIGLVVAQRPIFFMGLAIASVVGVVCLMGSPGGCTPALSMSIASFQNNVARRELGVMQTGLARFALDCKRDPDAKEGLPALINNPGLYFWKGPYVTLLRPDPWGHPYGYRPGTNGNAAIVFSAGPDGVEDTPDDIHPPALNQDALKAYVLGREGDSGSVGGNP